MPTKPTSRSVSATKSRAQTKPTRELIFGDLWEYDPAPESADPKLKPRYQLFINGKFVAPKGGKLFPSINPGNEAKLCDIALAEASDVDAAFKAAHTAFTKGWSTMPGRERGKYLYRIARLLQDRARKFAVAETLDGGLGNDTYTIDQSGDVIVEEAGGGVDTIESSVTHTLETHVENLTLTGGADIDGYGNALDNILTGNSAANTLTGNAGNDTLDGKAGADILVAEFYQVGQGGRIGIPVATAFVL